MSGLVIGGFGFGAFAFGYISTNLVNPNNAKTSVPLDGSGSTDKLFPKDVADQVPHMLHVCLMIWTALALLAVLGVSRNPRFVEQEKLRARVAKLQTHNAEPQNH